MRSKEEKLEFKKGLEARTLGSSIRVFKLLNGLPKNSAMRVISYQSKRSFVSKMIRTFEYSEHSNISPLTVSMKSAPLKPFEDT